MLSCTAGCARTYLVTDQTSLSDALKTAEGGDTILLETGSYTGFSYSRKFPDDKPLLIKSKDLRKAKFDHGRIIYLWGAENIILDGFELTAMHWIPAQGLIHIEGNSRNITIRNCYAHHAGVDDDCIKVNHSENINVVGCHLDGPGARLAGNGRQETLDYYAVEGGLIRGNLFTGGTSRQYVNAKGGSRNVVIENNVMLDHNGDQGDEALILGGWSGKAEGEYEGADITARNNVIIGSKTGAFQVRNVKGARIYNNLVLDCTGQALIHVVPGNGKGANKGSIDVHIFNNIFCNPKGDMPQLMRLHGTLDDFRHAGNLYYNGGKPVPSDGPYDPNHEENAVLSDPLLEVTPAGTYDEIVASLRLRRGSPATDAGVEPATKPPEDFKDIRGAGRPQGNTYDIGPLETAKRKGD